MEVDLCGHATLAAAHALFFHEGNHDEKIRFDSRSGNLTVARNGDWLSLDFPMDEIAPMDISESLSGCFSCMPEEIYKGKTDYMFVYKKQKDIEQIIPDYEKISGLDARGVIITAPGDNSDFVSRFFAPLCGINEDPVTGSAHTTLAPYWANRLNKRALSARQVSSRGGNLRCEIMGDRVTISGAAVTYLIGDVQLNKS